MRIGIIEARNSAQRDIIALARTSLGLEVRALNSPADVRGPYGSDPSPGPDVLLLGLDSQAPAALNATRFIRQWAPGCSIIMYGAAIDPQSFNQGMALGAKLCLGYPFDDAALAGAIATCTPRPAMAALPPARDVPAYETPIPVKEPIRESKVLTMFSPKGGVGTSVLAINLACALTSLGRSVALIDGNVSFGTVGLLLDFHLPVKTMMDIIEADETTNEPVTIERIEGALEHHESGLAVLLSPLQPVQAAQVSPAFLTEVIAALRTRYEFVIIDTQTSYEERELQLLDLADRIIVPIAPEVTALHSLRAFIDTATSLLEYPREKLLPVLVRSDTVTPHYIAQAEAVLGQPFVWRVVSDGPLVRESVNNGEPFVLNEPEAVVSRHVRALAAYLAGEEAPVTQHAQKGGWRLSGPIIDRVQEALRLRG